MFKPKLFLSILLVTLLCMNAKSQVQSKKPILSLNPGLSYAYIISGNVDKAFQYIVPSLQIQYHFSNKIIGGIDYSYFANASIGTNAQVTDRDLFTDFHYISVIGKYIFRPKYYGIVKLGPGFPSDNNYKSVFAWSLGVGYRATKGFDIALLFNSFHIQNYITSITNQHFGSALNTIQLRFGYNFVAIRK